MESQHFGPHNQPFTTQDALLAACLYFSGVPFWDERWPCIHRYNAGILNKLGYSGLPLEEAANKAFAARKRGNIEYVFKWPKELPALVKAFHDEESKVLKGEGTAAQRLSEIMELNVSPEERLVRISCLMLKMRVQFMRLWESVTPRLRIGGPGKGETQGNVTRYGPWKDIPLNASKELKQKMGL